MYLLDTNAYVIFFQNPPSASLPKLEKLLETDGGYKEFSIPEVVSMEIHSVLGKYRRGGAKQQNTPCDRKIISEAKIVACINTCIHPARRRLSNTLFRALQKMIDDAEKLNGDLRARVIPVGTAEFLEARKILLRYADQHQFGSHDALVAGTAACAIKAGTPVTLVTSDKGLKAVCMAENIPVVDPNDLV